MKVSINVRLIKLYKLDPKPEDLSKNKLKIYNIGGLNSCLLHKTEIIFRWE